MGVAHTAANLDRIASERARHRERTTREEETARNLEEASEEANACQKLIEEQQVRPAKLELKEEKREAEDGEEEISEPAGSRHTWEEEVKTEADDQKVDEYDPTGSWQTRVINDESNSAPQLVLRSSTSQAFRVSERNAAQTTTNVEVRKQAPTGSGKKTPAADRNAEK